MATLLLGNRSQGLRTHMKFTLEVGEVQKHMVEYNFDQWLGKAVIKVNQQEVKRSVRLFNEPLNETHTIQVPGDERLQVRIEKERKVLFGQKCRVFVNNRLYK